MSHECPDCGELCHCNGDIDDCMFNLPRDVNRCTHWTICGGDDGDDYEDEYYDKVQP